MSRIRSTYLFCPECNEKLNINFSAVRIEKCNNCEEIKSAVAHCTRERCQFKRRICESCDSKEFEYGRRKHNKSENTNAIGNITPVFLGLIFFLFLSVFVPWCWNHFSKTPLNANLIEKLRKDFSSQKNETWYDFLSVLEKDIPTVKSIIFLHDGEKRTSNCLTNELVSLYSGNKSLKSEDITFSATGYKERDYGFALEHYRSVVERYRILVTDLTEVPGKIARIFHSLCDEFSSDIKPSLFIFTLKYDKRTVMLKPLKRAETILKEAWSDLPENELFPLITRVIKNVVDVVPEKLVVC